MGDPRIQPLTVGHAVEAATAQPPPITTTKSKPTLRWPSTACASLKRQAPNLGQTTRRRGHGGRPRRPAIQPYGCLPHYHAPRPHFGRTADAGRHGHRTPTPDAGGRTLDTWTLRHPHRTPNTDCLDRHRGTLDTRSGHRRGQGDDSTAGARTPGPPRRATACWDVQPCSCSRTTRQLLGRSVGQAAPRRTAVLRRLRVERKGNGEAPSVMADLR
jgi:hypothetical protein